jgi:hypothetical protein
VIEHTVTRAEEETVRRDQARALTSISLHSVVVIALIAGLAVRTATAFEDPKGRFSIDLPEGWQLAPQTEDTVFVFQGEGSSVIVQYLPTIGEAEALFANGMTMLKDSGLPNASPAEEIRDLEVNGNEARLGFFSDEVAYGGVTVQLYGLLGSVALNEGGLYLLSILNDTTRETIRAKAERAFHSIRNPGREVTGVREVAVTEADAFSTRKPAGAPGVFEHELLTLTLPPGWASSAVPPGSEKEIIGWLTSERIPGATVMVGCYRGFGQSFASVRIAALRTLAAAYPQGQKMLEDKKKIRTKQGKKALVELWQGVVDSGGQAVLMQSPMGVVKTKHCWAMMMGFVADSFGAQLKDDFTEILGSAR